MIIPYLEHKVCAPAIISYEIAPAITKAGGKAYIVGGWVRDRLLGIEESNSIDYDVEVFNIDTKDLKALLSKYGTVKECGASFGVLKFRPHLQPLDNRVFEIDFSIPRRERKAGVGHTQFDIECDPTMTFEEAALRRDLTINAIGLDVDSSDILDPYNGVQDIKDKRIKHVSDRFAEDPLRVMRVAQFAARFEFHVDESTIELCRSLVEEMRSLPRERYWAEFKKLLLKSDYPSIGFTFLDRCGAISLFPELEALKGVEQNPFWHPEGDVWVHTMMVINEAAKLRSGVEDRDIVLMLAALCHDLGKPITTIWKDDKWRSPGHEEEGEAPTRSFLAKLTNETKLIEEVVALVKDHLKPTIFYEAKSKMSAIRRLSLRVDIPTLVKVAQADQMGRTHWQSLARDYPAGSWMMNKYKELKKEHSSTGHGIERLLKGRHLIEIGVEPGPDMGKILDKAFEAQLDGEFKDEIGAINWASEHFDS